MATTTNLEILQHLEAQLSTIAATSTATSSLYATATASAYNFTVQSVDREYIERSYDQFPFIYINDVDDQYVKRICKNLYQKVLEVMIVGLVCDDRTVTTAPQLGTTLQKFKNDVQVALSPDVDPFFNTSDIELQLINIETEDQYVPPNATFVCIAHIQYFSEN
jgi:hypothetical protein